MLKSKSILFVIICLLLLAAAVCGCGASGEVESIDIRLMSVSLSTGLDIQLIPRDSKGFLVKTEGSLDARLWSQAGFGGAANYDFTVQEWEDLKVSSGDYTQSQGASINLPYSEDFFSINSYGSLEVTLTLPDGRSFADTINDILILELYSGC